SVKSPSEPGLTSAPGVRLVTSRNSVGRPATTSRNTRLGAIAMRTKRRRWPSYETAAMSDFGTCTAQAGQGRLLRHLHRRGRRHLTGDDALHGLVHHIAHQRELLHRAVGHVVARLAGLLQHFEVELADVLAVDG